MSLLFKNPCLVPDRPIAIGYKCSWFAVRDTNVQELAALFGLSQVQACNWACGLEAASKDSVFISPPIQGWRLVLGRQLPFAATEEVAALLTRASHLAEEAQFFATHRVVEFHCWMKAQAGTLVRAYAYLGDHNEVTQDIGPRTTDEPDGLLTTATLALLEEDEDLMPVYPDEELVMTIAAAWSIDPNAPTLDNELPALGVLGTIAR